MSDDNSMPAETVFRSSKRQKLSEDEYKQIHMRIESHEDVVLGRKQWPKNPSHHFVVLKLIPAIQASSDGRLSFPLTFASEDYCVELEDKLKTAWNDINYREVLELSHLQSIDSGSDHPPMSPVMDIGEKARVEQALSDSWKAPFRGDFHQVLLQNINMMYDSLPYKNMCAVVQSSGTGKSRMVDEMAKLVFTLPINIRSRVGVELAYPPPDDVLNRHLVHHSPWDESGCRMHYENFFQCLFLHALTELSRLSAPDISLVTKWYDLMNDTKYRHNFYEDVVTFTKFGALDRSFLRDLTSKVGERSPGSRIKVVIYIDEAHELKVPCVEGCTKLEVFCSVIADFCVNPMFCLLLSTQTLIHFFAPTEGMATSERSRRTTGSLAPVTETPFDCFLGLAVRPGALHIEDLSTPEYVAKWGRPLWQTLLGADNIKELIKLARAKLLGHHDIYAEFYLVKRDALTAVLDVLLAFDFEPSSEWCEKIQSDMVTSHLRLAYIVPEQHVYLRSGYSSEPLLAEAAAHQLWRFRKLQRDCDSLDAMVNVLRRSTILERPLVDAGELFLRVCLTRAYMDAVLQDLGPYPEGIIFHKGCKLVAFIQQLFEPPHAMKILNATPDNLKSDTTFSQAFGESMVRFTHFVKAGDPYTMTSEASFAAFARGMAFVGYQTHQAVDFVIPVLLNKGDALRESAMSAILIQIKRHVQGRSPETYSFSAEGVGFFPPEVESHGKGTEKGKEKEKGEGEGEAPHQRPYITLVAEVGIEPEVGEVHGIKTPTAHIVKQPEVIHHPHSTHPRYAIVVYGATDVYKYVRADKRAFLLGTHGLFEERPHPAPGSRDLMMKLKPLWQQGPNSYHWVEDTLLNGPQDA